MHPIARAGLTNEGKEATMKRTLLVLAAALLLPLGAAPFKVRNILEKALVNEREAVARYEAFAAKAMEENQAGAASLFRACARAERVHAARFAAALEERGLPVPAEVELHPAAGSTAENIRAAAAAEMGERDGIYHEALEIAAEFKDPQLARIFDQTRDTEVEHANLLLAAARSPNLQATKPFYVCDQCGYTTDIDLPMCALCRVNKHPHAVP